MRIRAFPAALLFFGAAASGQPVELPPVVYPDLPAAARDAAGFVPPGWTILSRRQGDLNGDGRVDLALLLRMNDPANIVRVPLGDESRPFDTNPHLLLVAFAGRSGGYRLAVSNHGLFLRPAQPFSGDVPPGPDTLRLERGSLIVFLEYLRGWARYRFRWLGGEMQLIGFDDSGVSGGCQTGTSINFLTGTVRLTAGYIGQDRSRTAVRRLERRERPTLEEIDLTEFFPEEGFAGEPLWCEGRAGG